MEKQSVIDDTRRWIASFVIDLDLCPFARRVFLAEKIRYIVTEACDKKALLEDLARELDVLVSFPVELVETTLLIHPRVLENFRDYNDFLDEGDRLVDEVGLRGTIQIAGFHPAFQFEGTDVDAAENFTNRPPHAMLHLLREASITAVADNSDDLLDIPQRNIQTLRRLGREKILEKLKAARDGR